VLQIFGSLASSRSRLHAAMRNPRQPQRVATTASTPVALNRLAGDRNQDSAARGKPPAARPHAVGGWHWREHGLLIG
jgi:hypothetical protein